MGGPSKRHAQAQAKGAGTDASSDASIPRFDGNRDPLSLQRVPIDYTKPTDLKNISEFLGLAGWYAARGEKAPTSLPQRPAKFNQQGKETTIVLNTFNVAQVPQVPVHQYDVAWGAETDPTKRALIKKIWASKAVQDSIGEPANRWIYDGNKLAWSQFKLPRLDYRITVDLDDEQNKELIAKGKEPRKPRLGKENKHTVFIRHTRIVDFVHLSAFLDGKADWSADCIDTINFLDHLMREHPSQRYTQIKKSFFQRGENRFDLGGGVEAFKGVFSSLRPVLNDKFGKTLSVNVDVANGTFWRSQDLFRALTQAFSCAPAQFIQRFREARKDWKKSQLKKDLRRFKRVGVTSVHDKANPTQWTIDEIHDQDPFEATFFDKEADKDISIATYFKKKYNLQCTAGMPVVKMTKKIRGKPVYLPGDWLVIDQNQRYNIKLSDTQTSSMIKFAVTLPKQRWEAVQNGLRLLDWANDPYLNHYGLKIAPVPAKVKARILPSPSVMFGAGSREATIKPQDLVQGRWRLDGRKFAIPNEKPIRAWGVASIMGQRGSIQGPAMSKFVDEFIKIFESHGGKIDAHPKYGKKPWMGPAHLSEGGEMVAKCYNLTGNRYNARPNFMIFIVNDKNVEVYRRIKKSCDIRFGCPSQIVQSRHVESCQGQYISNVCLKVNAKLGGATCVAKSLVIPKINPAAAATPTMIVGADVSHPAPGAGSGEAASFAAITMSADIYFTRYWADVQTNGNRVEMVTTTNFHGHFQPMAQKWMQRVGKGFAPKRVLYIRDGVSEGQYAAVLDQELRDMKECFSRLGCKEMPKFTVVIAGKRHHIRFFPEKGDRNNNPIPGTLVESGCTHPFEFDFYLCAHVAIKGTARPIHYQCILNEGNWQSTELEQFIFEHSYQYVRSTTPVSLHPAVYYAHLAADRSRAHTTASPVSSGKKEAKKEAEETTGSSPKKQVEIPPLAALNNMMGLKDGMWYI